MRPHHGIARGLGGSLAAAVLAGVGFIPAHAANPPQIEYVLVMNGHGKPRTSFRPGATVGFRVELYFVSRSASSANTVWRVTSGRRTDFHRDVHGGFHGPTRGNLFTQVQTMTLPRSAPAGTYTAAVTITVSGRHLSRSARFYVRR